MAISNISLLLSLFIVVASADLIPFGSGMKSDLTSSERDRIKSGNYPDQFAALEQLEKSTKPRCTVYYGNGAEKMCDQDYARSLPFLYMYIAHVNEKNKVFVFESEFKWSGVEKHLHDRIYLPGLKEMAECKSLQSLPLIERLYALGMFIKRYIVDPAIRLYGKSCDRRELDEDYEYMGTACEIIKYDGQLVGTLAKTREYLLSVSGRKCVKKRQKAIKSHVNEVADSPNNSSLILPPVVAKAETDKKRDGNGNKGSKWKRIRAALGRKFRKVMQRLRGKGKKNLNEDRQ